MVVIKRWADNLDPDEVVSKLTWADVIYRLVQLLLFRSSAIFASIER